MEGESIMIKVQGMNTVCGVATAKPDHPVECKELDAEVNTHMAVSGGGKVSRGGE
jgi:hypothetical protein